MLQNSNEVDTKYIANSITSVLCGAFRNVDYQITFLKVQSLKQLFINNFRKVNVMRNNSKSISKEKLQLFYDIVSKDEKLQSKVTLALSNEVKQLEKEKAELSEKLNKEV